jgi:ABC-type polysaccharide/polyol phosphate export permease
MKNSKSTQGLSLLTILGLIFLVLKLTGHITWAWGWVLLPFYLPFTILIVFIVGLILSILFYNKMKK